MRQQTVVVLCLASGFVGGYALSPITWQMLGAFTSNQSELPEVSSANALTSIPMRIFSNKFLYTVSKLL